MRKKFLTALIGVSLAVQSTGFSTINADALENPVTPDTLAENAAVEDNGTVTITVINEETGRLFTEDRKSFCIEGLGSEPAGYGVGGGAHCNVGKFNPADTNPVTFSGISTNPIFNFRITYNGHFQENGYSRYDIDNEKSVCTFDFRSSAENNITIYMKYSEWGRQHPEEETVLSKTALKGDLNGDGFFNIADVVMMQGYLAGKKTLDAETLKNADMNGDGKVNVFDLIAMKRKVVEKINEPQEAGDEPVSLGLWDYDSYMKYIEENDLADKIVTYDKISHIGKFRQCIILSNSALGDYSQIMYSLDDGSGHPLHLIVTELDKVNDDGMPDISDTEINLLDLRTTVSADIRGKYLYNGKTYQYSGGRLLAVSWNDGKYKYRITGSSMLYDYPIDADTYTSALLRMWEFAPISYSNEFYGTLENDYIITSTKELRDYFFNIYGSILECDVICPENEIFNEFRNKYDDEFFEKNVLLMKPFLQPSAGGDEPYYSIDGLEYFDDVLYVSYSENPYSGPSCDVIIPLLAQIVLPKSIYRADKVVWQRSDTSPSFDAEEIGFISVKSFPESAIYIREYSSPEKIGKIVSYLNSLHLKKNFQENPDEYNGMTWVIRLGFKNGDKKTVYLFGNMFYREEGSGWLRMNYNEADGFDELIYDNASD